MASSLEHLLRRIRDRVASSEEVDTARGLVAADDRLPDDLRAVVLQDEAEMSSDAAGLLSVLGCDDLGEILAEAIQAEAGSSSPDPPALAAQERDPSWRLIAEHLERGLRRVAGAEEIVEGVLRRLPSLHGWVWGPVLAEAVRAAAGQVDVAAPVMGQLDTASLSVPVADAVRAEAGLVDVVANVMHSLDLDEAVVPLAQAVRAEAGTIDLGDAVARELGILAQSTGRAAAQGIPQLRPANNNRNWGRVALALAAALVATVIGTSLPGGGTASPPLVFAHAEDVVIEDLSFGAGASGMVDASAEDGTLILWLDEEA